MKNQLRMALFFTTVYVVMLYAGFGTVSLVHLPVFLLNKGIAMTAAESLFMASLCLVRREKDAARFWTNACAQLVFLHIFLTLGIFSKAYFHKFFSAGQVNLTGEVVLLTGVLAVYCLWRRQASAPKAAVWRGLTNLVCALVAVHLFTMGYDDWLRVKKWNGALPPTTLLSFLLISGSLLMYLWAARKRLSPESE